MARKKKSKIATGPLSRSEVRKVFDYVDKEIGSERLSKKRKKVFFESFRQKSAPNRSTGDIMKQVELYLYGNVHKMIRYSIWGRVRMLYALGVPINEDFYKIVAPKSTIKFDSEYRIVSVFSNDEFHLFGFYHYKEIQTRKLANFVADFCRRSDLIVSNDQIATMYMKTKNPDMTRKQLSKRIRELKTQIHLFTHIDVHTRVKMMFIMDVIPEPDFLELIRKDAVVHLDYAKRIIGYKAFDRSFTFGNVQNRFSPLPEAENLAADEVFDANPTSSRIPKEEPTLQAVYSPLKLSSESVQQEAINEDQEPNLPFQNVQMQLSLKQEPLEDVNELPAVLNASEELSTDLSTPSDSSGSIDLHMLIMELHCLILSVRNPNLSDIESKLQEAFEKHQESSRKVPLQTVLLTLEWILQFVTSPLTDSEDVVIDRNTTISVKIFVKLLLNIVYRMTVSNRESQLQKRIEKVHDKSSKKRVPFERIKSAMESTLLLLNV